MEGTGAWKVTEKIQMTKVAFEVIGYQAPRRRTTVINFSSHLISRQAQVYYAFSKLKCERQIQNK